MKTCFPGLRSIRTRWPECHSLHRTGSYKSRNGTNPDRPKRDHGDPQSFRLRTEGKGKMVRAEGLEPSRALRPNGFSCPATAFAAPAVLPGFGVWTIPSPCPGY